MELLKRFFHEEEGQGLVEYALIIALVVVIAIVALRTIGNRANTTLTNAAEALPS